jgi:hypothetical protein
MVMAKYQANPVIVDAFVITEVGTSDDKGRRCLTLEDGQLVIATPDMLARMTPVAGDYWVIQSDNYVYLNPREIFLRKYSPKEV